MIHTVKDFKIINEKNVDGSLEFSCFFYDLTDVDNLISGSSDFSKPTWISGSSQFTYCWSLARRTLSFTSRGRLKLNSVQCVWLFVTPWAPRGQASLSITTARVHPNPWALSRWCHPTFSSSVVPFSSCPQSFPASGSFQMSQLFASAGQSIGVSASISVLPMNTQDWSPLG